MHPTSRLGVYELVDELGAGGMGVVWRAHDRRLGRDVALKILPPHLAAHPDALVRFEREARGLAALSHPNIVSIFDLGEDNGLRYIVTELLSGETLRSAMHGGPMPWRRATEICATIAEGLAAAHAKGILHRDLKPENIFITADDRVKILDFGLAKEVALSSNATTVVHQTEPGRILGTLGYTSPEQLRGEEMDFASDIFSLGCVLFEMMSGRSAFLRNNSAETIAAILTEEPPSLQSLTEVPPDISRIVQRCLEKRPGARFQSSSDLAFALRSLTVSQRIDVQHSPRRRYGVFVAIGAVAIIAIASYAIFNRREPATPQREDVSLAVIPFTADADHAYAGEGIAESLFRRLAPLQSVRVVSRKAPVNESHVLRGSIRGSSDDLTVAAEIVERASGRAVWKRSYEGDLLGLERRISSDAEQFLRSYAHDEAASAPARSSTVDPEAYREYLKGRHHWNKFTMPGFTQALEHFQRSIDRDPTYALAYAGLADTYTMLAFHGTRPDESMPKARAAAQRATELDPQLGEAYTSLGMVLLLYDWKWREAEQALRRGVELNPRYATAHHAYAVYLGVAGRADEALREIEMASELDPLSLVIYIDLAWVHYVRNDVARAMEISERAIRHDPKSPLARGETVWYLDHAGRYAEAIDMYESALRLEEKDTTPARELREALRTGGAKGYLKKKLELAVAAGEPNTTRAAILIKLGEHKRALDALEQAARERERDMIYVKSSPTYAALRGTPRFEKLLVAMGW
ncbi:MAG TPA: protein kinase [Thermoanaerobaculia bacterium]|nr:protein kinase [Thermoanaerobaculia bacterium]